MKKFLIVGSGLLLVGFVIFFIAFAIAGFDIQKLSTVPPFEAKEMIFSNVDQSITIKDDNVSMFIEPSPDDKIHLEYSENKNEYYEISEGDALVITKRTTFKWELTIDLYKRRFTVYLPTEYDGTLNVYTQNGTIEVSDITAKKLDLSTNNGICSISNVTADEVIMSSYNGKLLFTDVTAGSLNGSNSNGAINATGITADGDVTLKTSNGKLNFERLTVGGNIDLSSSNGTIAGSILGNSNDFTIIAKTKNGRNNLPENFGNGVQKLTAQTQNGNIEVVFID